MQTRSARMSDRRYGCSSSSSGNSSVVTIVLLGLVLLTSLDTISGLPYKRSLLRLCSRSLSDALTLVCEGRGYNEPFPYTGDDRPQDSLPSGPGLAEECCYHTCTMAQLEQYCKPESDVVKDSIWILNIPFPPITLEATSSVEVGEMVKEKEMEEEKEKEKEKERSRLSTEMKSYSSSYTDIEELSGELKCKIHRSNRARNHEINNAREDREDHRDSGRSVSGPRDFRRKSGYPHRMRRMHRRRRPLLLGKILGRTLIAKSAESDPPRRYEPPPTCNPQAARSPRSNRRKKLSFVRKPKKPSL